MMSERGDEGVRLAALVELRRAVMAERAAREDAETARERMRQAALDAVDAGASVSEAARLVGVPRSTLYRWRDGHHTLRSDARLNATYRAAQHRG